MDEIDVYEKMSAIAETPQFSMIFGTENITILGFDFYFGSKTSMVLPFPRDTIETMYEK